MTQILKLRACLMQNFMEFDMKKFSDHKLKWWVVCKSVTKSTATIFILIKPTFKKYFLQQYQRKALLN